MRRTRAGLALVPAGSVMMWFIAALAASTSEHAHRCHHRMTHSSRPQCHPRLPAELQGPDAQGNSMPGCPTPLASAAQNCGSGRQCCAAASETSRPMAMLLTSEHSYWKQLHAARPFAGPGTPPQSRALLLSRSAVGFPHLKAVDEPTSGLRIHLSPPLLRAAEADLPPLAMTVAKRVFA